MTKRIEKKLRCELTESEVLARGMYLADTCATMREHERAKKESAKQFADLIAGTEDRQRELSDAIANRYEYRLVTCAVTFHTPAEGMKQIVRLDTGELVEECRMTAEECQTRLFETPPGLGAEVAVIEGLEQPNCTNVTAAPEVIENPSPAELEEFHATGTDAIAAPDDEQLEAPRALPNFMGIGDGATD